MRIAECGYDNTGAQESHLRVWGPRDQRSRGIAKN
jgi:hypothetical protein